MSNPLVDTIVAAILDKKGEDVVSLDLTSIDGSICDTFIICNANSTVQVGAIADEIERATIEKLHQKPWRVQGVENCLWVAMDYVDVMVHIFQTEMREYYQLEALWADAPATRHNDQHP